MAVIGVVADDFTGTASAGVLVARTGAKTGLFFDAAKVSEFQEKDRLDAVYVSSNSRHLPAKEAYEAVVNATKELQKLGIKYYSKKIDTTMRGGIGYEIDAMLETLGGDKIAVMVTAMPASRRICVGGHSVIDGTILTETSVAKDVVTPVQECYIPELIQKQSKYPVELIPLKEVLKGEEHLQKMLQKARSEGSRIIIVDAISMEHVDLIAKTCVDLKWDVLAVDPGPFTMKMSYYLGAIGKEAKMMKKEVVKAGDKTVLLMVGSANPSTKTQIERLCNGNKKVIRISASAKEFAAGSDRAESEIRRVTEAVLTAIKIVPAPEAVIVETALHGEVMDLRKEDERYSYEPGTSSRMINTGLATVTELVLDAVGQEKIAGLVLTGGDTMESICRRIGVVCIQALDNIVAQVDVGRIIGKYDGLPVVVKGGFCGYEDVAIDIVDRIFAENAE